MTCIGYLKKLRRHFSFFSALERPGLKPITILIDALDECGIKTENSSKLQQIGYLFRSFQNFVTESSKSKRQVNICIFVPSFPRYSFRQILQGHQAQMVVKWEHFGVI